MARATLLLQQASSSPFFSGKNKITGNPVVYSIFLSDPEGVFVRRGPFPR